MLTRKVLRNRVITEKSNEEIKSNKVTAKCKLDDKENQLMNPNFTEQCQFKGRIKDKSLRSSAVKDSKNKPAKRILRERNNSENIQIKISVKSSGNESICRRNYRKQTASKLSVSQKVNNEIKGSINSTVKKQKRNIRNANQSSIKEYFKPSSKKEPIRVKINQLQKSIKQNNVYKKTPSKIKNNVLRQVPNIPIWKRQPNLNKSKNPRKQSSEVDVYDIAQDEELIASDIQVQKKKIHSQKRKVKKFVTKNKLSTTKNHDCKSNYPTCDTLNFADKRKALERDQIASHTINKKIILTEEKDIDEPPIQSINYITHNPHDENNKQDLCLSTSLQTNQQNKIPEHSVLDIPSLEPDPQGNAFLADLADELEKSFVIPKMTSTPDAVQGKTGVPLQKSGILNVSDISTVANANKNVTIATPCDSTSKSNLLKKKANTKSVADITLFESPTKEEKKKNKSSKKSIQINLFGEILNSSVNVDNLEDSVLKPKKAYHTPDNFKTHIARTKRTEVIRKEICKKSKEDMLIEKMTQHFEEVNGTELCIE